MNCCREPAKLRSIDRHTEKIITYSKRMGKENRAQACHTFEDHEKRRIGFKPGDAQKGAEKMS